MGNRPSETSPRRRGWCCVPDLPARRIVGVLTLVVAATAPPASAQTSTTTVLSTREQLSAMAAQAQAQAPTAVGAAERAAAIRARLRDGDFQVGDRVVVSMFSDSYHRDTLPVRSGRVLELPGRVRVPLAGVLRSEALDRVSTELLKYVKAQQIEVVPLTRLAVLGEVTRPGYFALASDLPLSDVIMTAGGPTTTADLPRTVIRRRGSVQYNDTETRQFISQGLTIDQIGLLAGDEIVVARLPDRSLATVATVAGALVSVVTLMVTMRR